MRYSGKKSYLFPALILSVIILLLMLNLLIKPDLTIKTFCEVFPKEKWVLTKDNNGQIISSVIDYTEGHTTKYSFNQFERGEYISLKFSVDKKEKYINRGDTIISIKSSELEDRLITVEGELQVAKANLKSQSTGQKESLIKEAETRLNYTREKIKEQEIMFGRVNSLHEKGLASQEEYETQKWILDLLEIEKKIYEAQLQNLLTGAKDEELNLIKSEINSIESRLDFLKNRRNDLTIISPISGYMANAFSPDTLLTLINDNEVILNTPVKIEDLAFLRDNQNIELKLNDFEKEYSGLIVSIPREVKFLNNQQVVFVSIKLENNDRKLLPGMIKEGFLRIKEISLLEYFGRILNT
jgi:hypothetical protein